VRLEALSAVTMKTNIIFCDVMPCSLIEAAELRRDKLAHA
jgi:hypothetical protein